MLAGLTERLDLRFKDTDVEEEFRADNEVDLGWSIRLGACLYAVVGGGIIVVSIRSEYESDHHPFSWELDDPRTIIFSGWLFMFTVCIAAALAAHWSLRGGPKRFCSEAEAVALFFLLSTCQMVFSYDLIPVIMMGAHNIADAWSGTPSRLGWYPVVLSVVGPAVLCPVRTHMALLHPIYTATIFTINECFLDVYEENLSVLTFPEPVMLYTFAAFSIVNAWNREAHRRGIFMALRTQEQLQFAKDAAMSLLRMTCDSAIWVSSKSKIVLESDRWLDHIMEKPMTGASLTECFPPDSRSTGELMRLLGKKPGKADAVPVSLLPVLLVTGRGVTVSAEMFVVDRRLGRSGSSTSATALTDAMGTMIGIRCRTEMGGSAQTSSFEAATTTGAGSTTCESLPAPEGGLCLLAEKRPALEGPPSCSVSQIAPAPSCIGSFVAEEAIWLPKDAAVLLGCARNRKRAERAISLSKGDEIYCLCGSLSEPILVPVPIALVETSRQEIIFRHVELSHQGHKQHDLLATAASGVLVQTSTRRLQWKAALDLAPSDLYEVVAADRNTVSSGLSEVRYQASLKHSEQFANAISLILPRRVLGVLARKVADGTDLSQDQPFFVIAAGRSFPEVDTESAVFSMFSSSQASSRLTRLTFADEQRGNDSSSAGGLLCL
eukprot:TRINITY_DN6346_c0_g1_i3.p1 TRINITY_DN6346_c0_g1~~TRINITY_DN6346_c0_g1_i3.p1  ORF type:complete len:663 (+),score=89.74 TRINITY_DN6346_c0_g1_i3:122-2110(+)